MTICQQIARDYPALAELALAREAVGLERYGKVVDAIGDPRDWRKEAAEELIDALVYLRAEQVRHTDEENKETLGRGFLARLTEQHLASALETLVKLEWCPMGWRHYDDACAMLLRALCERHAATKNLTATQRRCTELVEEKRTVKAALSAEIAELRRIYQHALDENQELRARVSTLEAMQTQSSGL